MGLFFTFTIALVGTGASHKGKQLPFPGSFLCQKVSVEKLLRNKDITKKLLQAEKRKTIFYHDFRKSSSDSVRPFDITAALPSSMLKIPTPN